MQKPILLVNIFHSHYDVFRFSGIFIYHLIYPYKLWISCTYKADTHNANLNIVPCTQNRKESYQATAHTRICDIHQTAVAAMFKTPVGGPLPAAVTHVAIKILIRLAINTSVQEEWLSWSGRAPSGPSETPRWRITPRPGSFQRVGCHIAL
jgi:hypothetical protein